MEGQYFKKDNGYGAQPSTADAVSTDPTMKQVLNKLDNLIEHFSENAKRIERVTDHTFGGVPKEASKTPASGLQPGLMGEVFSKLASLGEIARDQSGTLNRLENLA